MRWVVFVSVIVSWVPFTRGEASELANVKTLTEQKLLFAENETLRVGIDAAMGASITHLSWSSHPFNVVNIHDPGRLIQQSYYAGQKRDRRKEGQYPAWSPWVWNPIQGGGVKSWARVTQFESLASGALVSETVPKLWDMPDEEAAARMRQKTELLENHPNAIRVECEFESLRRAGDRWEPPQPRHQELPALYFTREFDHFQSYLGKGEWQVWESPGGPPWSRAEVPLCIMACFNEKGQGIAVFSPSATEPWNFGSNGPETPDRDRDSPCVHLAPLATLTLPPRVVVRYRYWLVVGTKVEMVPFLDELLSKYGEEEVQVTSKAAENTTHEG